jgi:hypothetical protein
MNLALIKHNDQIVCLSKKYNGMIIKMIGDAYMISFNSIKDGITFAYDMCILQKENPIILNKNDSINIRIGLCYGSINLKKTKIQNKSLIDLFGSPVNMASRMESKVSDVGGFAFSIYGEKKINKNIILLLKKFPKLKYILQLYTFKNCKKIKRSERLLSSGQLDCLNAEILKGVGEVLVYKCNI